VEFALFGVFSGSQLAWIRSSLVNYVIGCVLLCCVLVDLAPHKITNAIFSSGSIR
jgi:hypothetical protein